MKVALVTVSLLIKLVDLVLMLAGIVLIPLGLLREKDNHMPKLFWLWDNLDHGVDGGNFYAKLTVGWPRFLRCYVWSAFRNPTFNWAKYVIGYTISGVQTVEGNPRVDRDKAEGWYWVRDGYAWEYQYIKAYTLFGRRCFKFRAGWKIQGQEAGKKCQFVFAVSPMTSYTGI